MLTSVKASESDMMIAVVDFKLVEFVPDSRQSYQVCRSRKGKPTGAR